MSCAHGRELVFPGHTKRLDCTEASRSCLESSVAPHPLNLGWAWDCFPIGPGGSTIPGLGVQALRRLGSFLFLPLGSHDFGSTGLCAGESRWGGEVLKLCEEGEGPICPSFPEDSL